MESSLVIISMTCVEKNTCPLRSILTRWGRNRMALFRGDNSILFLPHLVKMLRRGHVFFSTQVIEIMTRELSIAPRKYTLLQNYFVHDPSLSRLKSHSHTISLFYCFCKTLHIWQSILEIVRTHFAAKGGGGQKSEKSEPQF